MKSISEVAKEFGVTTRTIRYYEEIGLLKPTRNEGNHRFYGPADLVKLKLIQRGKQFGFQLDEIKEMVLLFDQDRTGTQQLKRTIEYGKQRIHEIENKIIELEEMKEEMEKLLIIFSEKLK
ncbi:MerR family DNA-binding transcriptional regulator [Psychrobacillus sp. NPDC096389]|uniref:MerR family transcriptional regulator n=1 Tax=Psychrobacillus sp. NPDC096389 TaxID=3364490 RepID=UPI0037FE25C3